LALLFIAANDFGGPRTQDRCADIRIREELHVPRGIRGRGIDQEQGLAERLPKDRQQEIRGELHPHSGPERSDMLHTTAKLVQQWFCAGELASCAAHEADQRPRLCSGNRAADGTLDKAGIARRQRRGDPRVHARAYGAHIDEETSFHATG